ncbi:MAG: M23 family metallopeptidase [Candidatus Hydrogenedentota bacterium]|nr:MAG: M23 family metallopeptidase [Candidatus Hydrogenedentota bacterium]
MVDNNRSMENKENTNNKNKQNIWQLWHAKITDIYEAIKQKGHERLTIMFVPHGEAHIFSLQLSKFSIAFTLLILLAIIIASSLAWNFQQDLEPEVAQLKAANQEVYQERELYMRRLEKILDRHANFEETLTDLYQITYLPISENDNLPYLEQEAEKELEKEAKQYLQEMESLIKQETESEGLSITALQKQLLAEFKKSQIDENFRYNDDVKSFRIYRLRLQNEIHDLDKLYVYLSDRIRVQRTLPYKWPLKGGHITSMFGLRVSPFGYSTDFHTGIDIANAIGTPIYSAGDGIVVSAGWAGGYGLRVLIRHDFGFETVYGHMSKIYVRAGMRVRKGQLLGEVGQTGRATGPHVHFEVRLENKPINPFGFITAGI